MTPEAPRPLLPADAAVALRSLPRRFRSAAAPRHSRTGDDPYDSDGDRSGDGDSAGEGDGSAPGTASDRWNRYGPDGRSALALVVDAVRSLTLLDRALEQVLVTEDPVLHPAVLDRNRRTFHVEAHVSASEVLEELDDIAPAMADRVQRTRPEDWHRTGRVAGHAQPVTALALVAEAVDTAVTDLRALQAALAAAEGSD